MKIYSPTYTVRLALFVGLLLPLLGSVLAGPSAYGRPYATHPNAPAAVDSTSPATAGRVPFSCTSGNHAAVQHCPMNGVDVLKIDLNDPNITIEPVIAPNGGLSPLSALAGSQGIVAINADYRLGACTNGVNCGEGLTYVQGNDQTRGPPDTYNYRRSLAFNHSYAPHIGFPNEQGDYHWNILGGGPRFTENGTFHWACNNGTQNQDCPNTNGTVVINDEYFGASATNWWNRPQSAIGYSDDGHTVFLASSAGNVTMQSLHDVLWQQGARNNLKLDGGSARSLYYNDGSGASLYLGSGISEPSAWVVYARPRPTPPPAPTPPSCNPGTNQVTLYADTNFGGGCVTLNVGDCANPGCLGNVGNDNAESIRVGSSVQAVLFQNDNYQGGSETFTADDANLNDNSIGGNQVSSVRVQTRPCNPSSDQVTLYADTNYGGSCVTLGVGDCANPGCLGSVGNDNAESIRIGSNVQASLYQDDNYQGRAETLTADDANLNDNTIGGNAVSSVRVAARPPTATPILVPTSTPLPSVTAGPPSSPTATSIPVPTTSPGPSATVGPPSSPTATPPAGCRPFSDVQPSDYFYTAVTALACQGVISGYSDGSFRPYNLTTRAQLAKIVVGAEGWPLVLPTTAHFRDVPTDSPFYAYIETALAHGIISGYSDGTFRPSSAVTRGQVSKIVVGARGWAVDTSRGPHFRDVPPANVFYPAIETAIVHGIISGYNDGTFRPGNAATRGQIAKVVYLALQSPLASARK